MLEATKVFFITYWPIVGIFIGFLTGCILISRNWEAVRYFLMRFGTNFPMVGKVASLAKQPRSVDPRTGHRMLDETIATAYLHYYKKQINGSNKDYFLKCQDYLMKAEEQNRKEKGIFLWVLIGILVAAEAAAFGMVLAPFAMTKSVTPNMAITGAVVLGTILSIILLAVSEITGHKLYHNRMINQILAYGRLRKKAQSQDHEMQINITNTNADDSSSRYQQMMHRIKPDLDNVTALPKKSYVMPITYLVFICIVAVGAYLIRSETLKAQEAEIVDNPMASMTITDEFEDSSELELPSDMKAASNDAANKTAQERIDALHRASLITFMILSFLFLFIQIGSTYFAYAYGFVGAESAKAWETIRNFSTAESFYQYHKSKADSIAVDAQASLTRLAELMSARQYVAGDDDDGKNLPALNFLDFAKLKIEEENKDTANKDLRNHERTIAARAAEKLPTYIAKIEEIKAAFIDAMEKGDTDGEARQRKVMAQYLAMIPTESLPEDVLRQAKSILNNVPT